MKKIMAGCVLVLMSCSLQAAVPLQEFKALLAIPNASNDILNLRRNAEAVKTLFNQSGIKAQLIEAKTSNVAPLVFAEWTVPGATKTLLFYAHYDGVPANVKEWTVTPPYHPVILSNTVSLSRNDR